MSTVANEGGGDDLTGGGPVWRGDGKELFYPALDRKMMATEAKATPQNFDRGTPQALFEARTDTSPTNFASHMYSVTADGKRFLIATELRLV